MRISYQWLQTYFPVSLPPPDECAAALVDHAFEIESVEARGADRVWEVKILPDRAHDCLSYRGLARELGAILDRPLKLEAARHYPAGATRPLTLQVASSRACPRYLVRVIEGVAVGTAWPWLRERLELMNQKSVNNIVDCANLVMFDVGQPLHVFDADLVRGGLVVRFANVGEAITTLDGQSLALDAETLVIADEAGPLAIAGIKGGERAAVTERTSNLILESANFDPVLIRRTAVRLNLRTEAARRFWSGLTPALAEDGLAHLTSLILDQAGGSETRVGEVVYHYLQPAVSRTIPLNAGAVERSLGVTIPAETIIALLRRLRLEVAGPAGGPWRVTVPLERLDLVLPIDLVEEIGRLYGYDHLPSSVPAPLVTPLPDAEFLAANYVRQVLLDFGFSEVYGYALTDHGDVELLNPLATDKNFLRINLSEQLSERLADELKRVLFNYQPVRLFEIGKVFPVSGEVLRLGLAVAYPQAKYKKNDLMTALQMLKLPLTNIQETPTTSSWEMDFAVVRRAVGDISTNQAALEPFLTPAGEKYRLPSPYPRILRDVAVWVPMGVLPEAVIKIIAPAAGPWLIVGPILFDEFKKDGQVSYAFRLVFQATDRTLTDDEVNQIMMGIVSELEEKEGWQVRK